MSLDCDVLTEILGRVDSKTLAKAACVSSRFSSIATQESLWEDACSTRWPSTQNPQLKHLISSLPGGFRKFYASCFSVIKGPDEVIQSDSAFYDHFVDPASSDLMWVVDVQYENKPIFSKIVWEVPYAGNCPYWYLQSPFQIDIINLHTHQEDGLPTIMSVDEVGTRGGEMWRQLMENMKLSWIVINKRTGEAANLSSWSPLAEQRNVKYNVQFGSLLPAVDKLPCNVVKCILEMKYIVLATGGQSSLKMTELGIRLEDMSGDDVNGSKGLRILERSLRYNICNGRNKVLELQGKYLAERSNLSKEYTPTPKEVHRRRVWIVSVIITCVSLQHLMSLLGIVVPKN